MHTNGKILDFNFFRIPGDFTRSIYFDDVSLSNKQQKNKIKWNIYLETWKLTIQEILRKQNLVKKF